MPDKYRRVGITSVKKRKINNMSNEEIKTQIVQYREKIELLEKEIGRILVGQRQVVRDTMIAMIAGGHILFEGVPGLGKTLLVRTLAKAVNGSFSRIQFTPDLMPADITGTNMMSGNPAGDKEFVFQRGPLFANIVLADEINRSTPKTQSALLEAMQEHSVTVCGQTHRLEEMFFVLATQNPLEMEGTFPLPEAQLDRFFSKILVPYPTEEELFKILERTPEISSIDVEAVLSTRDILEIGRLAHTVPVARELTTYMVRLIKSTHPDTGKATIVQKYVQYGSSPRGAQALLLASKIAALLDGRFNVSLNDIKSAAPMVLRHRMILNFEGQAENVSADDIIEELLRSNSL